MTRRHKKKIGKQRGTRTVGGGNTKNRRGKGSKMGNPHIKSKGGGQRNFMYVVKYQKERLHKKGFKSKHEKEKTININKLGKLSDEKEINVLDFGYEKVLGRGELDKKIKKVASISFSKTALNKIEEAGAEAVKIGETQ